MKKKTKGFDISMVYLNYLLCEVLSVWKGNKMSDDYVLVLRHTPVVEAVSRNIQYMYENVFESNKKLIRENYAIVKINTFCIYTDNNSSKILFLTVLFFPNSMWLSCWIQIPPLGNGLVLIDDLTLNCMLGKIGKTLY